MYFIPVSFLIVYFTILCSCRFSKEVYHFSYQVSTY